VAAVAGPEWAPEAVEAYAGLPAGRIRELALRLAGARAPLILGGGGVSIAPAETETALAAALLNLALETPALDLGTRHAGEEAALPEETAAFIRELAAGEVETLLILGANPAYSLPPESGFQYALERVPTVVALSPYRDETAELAHWVLPVSTPLESWGDYEPQTGVANLQQPVMGSLYETPMPGDALLELLRAAGVDPEAALGAGSFYDFLRKRWQEQWLGTDYFEEAWSAAVQRGWREDLVPSMPAPAPRLRPAPSFTRPAPDNEMRLWLHPSLSHFDGRGANRRWLQELPDPVTQMAWDSWLEIHPDEAARLGLRTGDLLQMASAGTPLTVPAYVHPGVALGTVALALGQGHTAYGRYAQGTGVNAAVLLGGEAQTGSFGTVNLTPAGAGGKPRRVESATSQEGRAIVRTVALAELEGLRREPLVMPLPEGYTPDRDMYPPHSYAEHRWAMTVDLSRCVGCGACVTACYAENNVGVVGPREIGNNRVMSWIRVDRYADWREAGAPVLFQPMLCQHCDAAPCEPVCPVFASAHNEEGLNMQVYNRCVGTRYCSNNCPYKVRRFNWFDYEWPEPLNWQANPEVTVRRRGVMEKCSFCIQRIREAEFAAEEAGRPLRDGEIVPACAQTCPAGVFTFGDLMDPASRVSQIVHGEPRAYQALDELNTKPAVFYLKRVVEARA
jgi:molybdopterin-containing oxidoreductase family iron-sulfur binding subunit